MMIKQYHILHIYIFSQFPILNSSMYSHTPMLLIIFNHFL